MAKRKAVKRRVSRYRRKITRTNVKRSGMNLGRVLKRASKDALILSLARRLVPNIGGVYQGSLDKICSGGALKMLGQGGSSLIEVGIAEAGSTVLDTRVMPLAFGAVAQAQGAVQPAIATTQSLASQSYATMQALYQRG